MMLNNKRQLKETTYLKQQYVISKHTLKISNFINFFFTQ